MMLTMLQSLVGLAAGLATVAQMFIGVFVCNIIYRNRSTKKVPSTGFVGGLVISLLLLQQSRLLADGVMRSVSWLGVVLNTAYLIFYYNWSRRDARHKLTSTLGKALSGVGILMLYTNVESPEKVVSRFGTIVTLVMLSFIACPLLELPRVMEKKSTEGLPYPMILSGFVVSLLWLLYSVLQWNRTLIIQNGIALVVCGIQLSLFYIYPDKGVKASKSTVQIDSSEEFMKREINQ